MALSLLNGSLATIDVTLDTVSIKCAFGRWSIQFNRGSTSTTTFCSGGWVSEQPGQIQGSIQLDGFAGKGVATYTNPLAYITKATPVAMVLTADTGVTLTGDANCFGDSMEMVAAANAGRSISFRTNGSWVSAGFTTP